MARRRMIDPHFWNDEEFVNKIVESCKRIWRLKRRKEIFQMSRTVRLFYIALWNFADDSGRFCCNERRILGSIAAHDRDIDREFIGKFFKVLAECRRVFLYQINGVNCGVIVNFLKHQTINRPTPSKLPAPPEPEFSEWLSESGGKDSVSDSRAREVKLKDLNIPAEAGPKEIQNQNIEATQKVFEERFEKHSKETLTAGQVQVLAHGGGNGKVYGFNGSYEALRLAISDIPADARSPTRYLFEMASDGIGVEKRLKKLRGKAEAEAKDKVIIDF